MRSLTPLLLTLLLAGCISGIETEPADTARFAAGSYQSYAWRRPALPVEGTGADSIYQLDPVLRAAVDETLATKGYRRVTDNPDFLVDYIAAAGLSLGEVSQSAANVSYRPAAVPNRNIDQASIDNAYALGTVRETANIGIILFDAAAQEAVWNVRISKIIEDRNRVNADVARRAIRQGLRTLPEAP
ncbi:DUF4136 domain-containing protein [Pseudohaliea rubra]|uniref:DUF4136 domain-containing protein n=1 Tax=Pseudohaliea rubra DSM 19751 TaxID=1265313 RepID=A0A095VRJ0_9GAMM|nr:DUF4136 domain-containing protein [Pseudohaliea rubra]KGE04062.1 hypothetical protein HRUBRA_01286 [Pseudohaliea rubra DSM 19751]